MVPRTPASVPRPPTEAGPCPHGPRTAPLLSLARRMLGCPDLAWDAVQEALIALWQTSPPPDDPQAWLAGAVVRRSLHHLRTLGRRRTHECRAARTCAWSLDPASAVEREELRGRIASAVAALPPEFRQAFLLREVEELDYAEIARLEGVPVGTVRSRIHRARRRLRDLLEVEGEMRKQA